MFARKERLSRAAFPEALKAGKRLSSTNFSVVIAPRARGYAVVVSKKTARLSVTRHRIKRRVLAALRSLPSLPPSLIAFPRASVLDLSAEDLRTELSDLLSKVRRGA